MSIVATVKIRNNPKYDHEQVTFEKDGKEVRTGAYRGKNGGLVCLIKCPVCQKENYAMNVSSGSCTWCGYNPNTDTNTEIVEVDYTQEEANASSTEPGKEEADAE